MGWFSSLGSLWGRPHADIVNPSADHADVRFILPEDTALYAAAPSRMILRERFEWCRQSFGLMQEMVAGVARQTIGKGLILQFNTSNPEWNNEAERQFEQWALTPDRCDAAGRRNFYEAQTFAVEQFVGPGEFFCRDVVNPRWDDEPCFQIYDPSEIASPRGNKDESVLDGVRVDGQYNALGIFARERTATGYDYVESPAQEWTHWFKASTANQVRGITPYAPALKRLVGMYELERLTIRSAKAHQLIALVLKGFDRKRSTGAFGGIGNASGPGGTGSADYDATKDTAAAEKLFAGAGGAIAYVGAEGDAKIVSSTQPSPLISQFFKDLLMRDVCLCAGFPMEWFWDMSALGGPGQRALLAKVDGVVQILADSLIYRWIRRTVFRFISYRIKKGLLAQPDDPMWCEKMSFQCPARVTIDNSRDINGAKVELDNGMTTIRDIYDRKGQNWKEQTRQWLREPLAVLAMAKEMGYTPTMLARLEANMPLWRAAAPGAAMPFEDPEAPAVPPAPLRAAA